MEGEILRGIKKNKKYKTISDEIVEKEIAEFLRKNPKIKEKIKNKKLKKAEIKRMVKEIRKKLHRIYSSYQTKKKNKRYIFLDELQHAVNKNENKKIIEATKKILSTTISTKERSEDYPLIYKKIFEITGKPETIVDIGAGLNPVSYPFMNLDAVTYYAYDIDNADIQFLNDYFRVMKQKGLNGKAELLDIRNVEEMSHLPQADVIFMFKVIDLIDAKKKKVSGQLIQYFFENKKTTHIIASFATKTLTRKDMNLPRRIGFEKMLKHLNLTFQSFSIDNEIFYVISQK